MPTTICIANQKGGVGKTTTSINLAAALGRSGQRTLLIDMDPQCNATLGLGRKVLPSHPLVGEQALRHQAVKTSFENLSLLPGSHRFRDIDLLANLGGSESRRVVDQLESCTGMYDFVLIDCPPSMGRLTQTALSASDEVLMPIQCEYFALEGLGKLLNTIKSVQKIHNPKLDIEGLLLTMYDSRLRLSNQVVEEVNKHFGKMVFKTLIQRNIRLSEAPSYGENIIAYDATSKGAENYLALGNEILKKNTP